MENKNYSSMELMKRFAPYFKKYTNILVIDLFCAALTVVCQLVLPLIVRYITNTGINNMAALSVEIILKLGLLYIILRIMDTAAYYYMARTGHIMGAYIETDMRRDMFNHLQKLSNSYYDNTKIGQLMSRITTDLFDITEFAHHCPEEYFIAALKIIISFVILASFNLPLTIIVYLVLPLMYFSGMYFRNKMRTAFAKSRHHLGEINSQVEDSLLGIRVIKSFANEDIEVKNFAVGNNKFLDIKGEMYRAMAGFQCGVRFFDGVMYIVAVVVGALFMLNGKITAGDLVAFLLYVTTLLESVRRIIEFTEQFQKGMTGIERFIQVMDEPIEIEDSKDAVDIKDPQGEIEFENVSFKYASSEENVINNLNLKIKKGENIAIVGQSGGGKTTICSLIPRFYDITEGRILFDGKNIKDVTLKSLRNAIGIVQQDVYLFSGTVFENIEYGKPGASKEEIIEAAKKAGAHEFIMSLPEGYDTYVGERGVKLSGGQKQRISIARVFLKNPPVLILDEATSALDNESEKLVQKSLEDLSDGRTTITVAHRLSTIKDADRIIVLTPKGIEEEGTHEELINKKGLYYDLYSMSGLNV